MRTATDSTVILVLASVLSASCSSSTSYQPGPSVNVADYKRCLEQLLPVPQEPLSSEEVRVVARVVPAERYPPFLVIFSAHNADSHIDVQVLRIEAKRGLDAELDWLLGKSPYRPADELCREIPTRSSRVTADQDPRLLQLRDRLQELELPAVPESQLFIHPVSYQAWTFSGGLETYQEWRGLDRVSPGANGPNPLAVWIYDLAYVLNLELSWRSEQLKKLDRRRQPASTAPDPPMESPPHEDS